ncbi:MAG: type IV pilus assembly protein PilM [Patescibacteria group bacterium]
MFNFLKPIFGTNSYLGIDIGTTSIKAVEIIKTSSKPKLNTYGFLESYGHLERLNDALQTSSLKIMDQEAARFLKILLRQLNCKTRDVVASIPSFSAFITLLEIPEMPASEITETMKYQIRQYIPLPASEVTIDWLPAGKRQDEHGVNKQQIVLVSVPNEQIRKYQNIFKLAGLNLRALEVESLALIRALIVNDPTPTAVVDIGARSTNIVIADKGYLRFNGQTDFAGGSLTQAIASSLNINVLRAEDLKKRKGLIGIGGDYELSTLTIPFLDAIITEVKRAKDNYEKNSGSKIERVILAGGGANLLGIAQYFEKEIGLTTVIGNPFSRVDYSPEIEPIIRELGPLFSVAIGLGIREFI